MLHALVSPQGTIDRIEANVDPTVRTRAGWRWLPFEETPAPDYSGKLENASAVPVVADGKVIREWTIERKPIEEQRQAVKAEARRRILDRFPDWRQANMTARGIELTLARVGREWTEGEQQEADAIQAAWDWVKAIRSASDVVEAMAPIPADFRDDKHWPE
jgi:hypothetical protein